MLWSDKAFGIYIGNAGEGIAPARGSDATDVPAPARTQDAGEDGAEVMVTSSGGWLARAVAAVADRAALTRIARS